MNQQQYQIEAQCTDVPASQAQTERLRDRINELCYYFTTLLMVSEKLDQLKKHIYYNSELPLDVYVKEEIKSSEVAKENVDDLFVSLIHSSLGMVTESTEFMQAVMMGLISDLGSDGIDFINLDEESGDWLWYFAKYCNDFGKNPEEIQALNINKLRLRYPENFTEFDAQNRNLDDERKLLEGNNEEA